MNIRPAIIEDVADTIGAIVLLEQCPDCHAPLMERLDQWMPFCWLCTCNRILIQRARTTLFKAKLAQQGIFIEKMEVHKWSVPSTPFTVVEDDE